MNRRLISLTALLFVLALVGCSGNEEEDNKIADEPQTPYGVKEGKAPERAEDFVSTMETKMLTLRDEMKRVEARIKSSSKKQKGEVDKKWNELKKRRQELEFSLDELVNANEAERPELKAEIKTQLKELKKLLQELKNELGME
ncbi:MAG TPA: hypothetical protein VFG39_09270 [Balneolaceae bacterium]|nr:hypothetical protein [Balneolaceae bacterium]